MWNLVPKFVLVESGTVQHERICLLVEEFHLLFEKLHEAPVAKKKRASRTRFFATHHLLQKKGSKWHFDNPRGLESQQPIQGVPH
jgi:hypothetical protein